MFFDYGFNVIQNKKYLYGKEINMEHMAWKGRIKPGCKAEYQRRHAEIWPEMIKVLKEAGICNYSIFYCKDELWRLYKRKKGVD